MLKRTNSLTTILILQQIQTQPQQPKEEEDHQERVAQSYDISPIKCAAKRRAGVLNF